MKQDVSPYTIRHIEEDKKKKAIIIA